VVKYKSYDSKSEDYSETIRSTTSHDAKTLKSDNKHFAQEQSQDRYPANLCGSSCAWYRFAQCLVQTLNDLKTKQTTSEALNISLISSSLVTYCAYMTNSIKINVYKCF